MKKSLRDRWCSALRSGQYQQGTGSLRFNHFYLPDRPVKHCCLGVLCEIANFPRDGNAFGCPGGPRQTFPLEVHLDRTALAFVGLTERDQTDLITMNDGWGTWAEAVPHDENGLVGSRSFLEIADWIEEHVAVEPDEVTPALAHTS